ncbi:L,D-transpeptidase family protein [Vogesella facilis]|uniref:L,D-transpeptidase family protein n=1 Tax=Vogesella facilis TaxID=1655232 RepID=A0ABV7RKV7_9NEIS
MSTRLPYLPALLVLLTLPALAASPPEAEYLLASQLQPVQAAEIKPNPYTPGSPWLEVGVRSQSLVFYDALGVARAHYAISTAKNGVGELANSYQTPRGWHRVCERIGDGVTPGTIIYRRQVTPWKYSPQLHQEYPDKDWILTRILWLCGMEPGKNQGGEVDSYDRAIYIHGAGEHVAFGTPTSRGCVRMRNEDIVELFALTGNGLDVLINENL